MESAATETVQMLARTQLGIFALALVAAIVGVLWALTTFGYIKPKNGSSVSSVTTELVKMNETLDHVRKEWGPKVDRIERGIDLLIDRDNRRIS